MKSAAGVMASRPRLRRCCVKEKRSERETRQIPRLDQRLPSLFRIIAASFPSSHRTNLPTTAAAAVATRKNARVRMLLPAKKEEGLGRPSERVLGTGGRQTSCHHFLVQHVLTSQQGMYRSK